MSDQTSRPEKRRVIAKQTKIGRHLLWGVYDTERGCWPIQIPGYGVVQQHVTSEEVAQVEADALESFYRGVQ